METIDGTRRRYLCVNKKLSHQTKNTDYQVKLREQ
jgi:hypothetical protein